MKNKSILVRLQELEQKVKSTREYLELKDKMQNLKETSNLTYEEMSRSLNKHISYVHRVLTRRIKTPNKLFLEKLIKLLEENQTIKNEKPSEK